MHHKYKTRSFFFLLLNSLNKVYLLHVTSQTLKRGRKGLATESRSHDWLPSLRSYMVNYYWIATILVYIKKKIELESHHHSSSFHRWTKGQSWNINLLSYNWKNCVAFRTTYFNWFGPLFALVQILLALQIVIKRFARAKLNEILFHMSWVTRNQRPSGNVVLDHFCIIHCPFVWLMTHESWVISARDLFRLRNWKWR